MKKNASLLAIAIATIFSGCKATNVDQADKSKITTVTTAVETTNSLNENQLVPLDKSIRKGVLENGMTYYLHSTDVTKDVASYYIIQNVGSILENDDQQGLAHFLEHMAFNGTESFPGKDMLNNLEENGLIFGRDINAYTSFDETVYNVNKIPTTPEMIETGLQILRDWSNYLLLTDEEIDAERGVIKEEWRTRQNGRMRILKETIDTQFGNSKYAERLPIGLMNIVENFEYKALRDFYHDWYRTDLQAIAIVGDIDVDAMEVKIKEKFSSIPVVENPPKRFEVVIDDNAELAFDIAMDKEVSTSALVLSIRQDKPNDKNTVTNLKRNLYNGIISSILNTRFSELAQKPDATFLYIQARHGGMARLHDAFNMYIGPKPNLQEEAFTVAINELNRAVKFGFTQSEINRVLTQMKSDYENQIERLGDRPHGQIIQAIQTNYLENEAIVDLKGEYELAKSIFENLTQEALLKQLTSLYTKENRTFTVTGVEGNKNLNKEKTTQIINTAENNADLKPYEEEEELQSLMTGVNLVPGKISSETKNEALGFTTFTLSNSIDVHYKYVDKNKNEVSLEAISDGGKSLLENDELPSSELIGFTAQMSGLGEFSATDLQKVLTGKQASVAFNIDEITESVSGSSSTKDVETMLQMANLRFNKPRLDENGYALMIQNLDNYLIRKSQDLGAKMQDSITTTVYGKNHPVKRLFDKDYVADMSLDKMKEIYSKRFANPDDFKFFIVGDVQVEELKPLLKKYIASLPTTNTKENWKDNTVSWTQKNIDKDILMTMEDPKGTVNITIKKEMPYSLKDGMLLKALGSILDLRYTATLREEEGGTYGASASAYLKKKPKGVGYISVNFDSNPALTDKLVTIVYREMEKIKNGEIEPQDLDKTVTSMLKARKDSKNKNSYDLDVMKNFILEGYNMESPENFENIVNSINKESIQDIAKRILTDNQSYEIVFKPKQ